MRLTTLKSALTWQTGSGRELVRLDEGANKATVIVSVCDEAELRALAQAALEAADQIAGFKADAA
jgi:hypothetical protein